MRFLNILFVLATIFASSQSTYCVENNVNNGCVSFYVGSGTGCAWMCNYCEQQWGTTNYYFPDGVCTYQEDQVLGGGWVGNPVAGKQYTCCSVSEKEL